MNAAVWTVKHRQSGLYFGGFKSGPEFQPIWVPAECAVAWDRKEIAVSQALLLRRFDNSVQIKPVRA